MKKFVFILFAVAVMISAAIIPIAASARMDVDSSSNSVFPMETNIDDGTDTSIFDSMMPEGMSSNVPDSAVDSNSSPSGTSPVTDENSDGGTSALIGVVIAIVAVAAVTAIIIALMPKNKNKK